MFSLGRSGLNGFCYSPLPGWGTVCWQHTSPPALSEISCIRFGQLGSLFPALNFSAAGKENFSLGWKLAGWRTLFSLIPNISLCIFWKPFENFFSSCCRWVLPVNLVDAGTFKNTILPFIFTHRLHQLWWIRIPLRCEGGPVFIPTGRLLGKGGWRLGGVCKGLSAERKRVNHVCNRTDFPLKWETEVGSVQIYGTP